MGASVFERWPLTPLVIEKTDATSLHRYLLCCVVFGQAERQGPLASWSPLPI